MSTLTYIFTFKGPVVTYIYILFSHRSSDFLQNLEQNKNLTSKTFKQNKRNTCTSVMNVNVARYHFLLHMGNGSH